MIKLTGIDPGIFHTYIGCNKKKGNPCKKSTYRFISQFQFKTQINDSRNDKKSIKQSYSAKTAVIKSKERGNIR